MRYQVYQSFYSNKPVFSSPWRWLAFWYASTIGLKYRRLRVTDAKRKIILREWAKAIGQSDTEVLKKLQNKAKTGNPDDITLYKVANWNAFNEIGDTVLYTKSDLEGDFITRTIGNAYAQGEYGNVEYPLAGFIDLEHIGMVLLEKVYTFGSISYQKNSDPEILKTYHRNY